MLLNAGFILILQYLSLTILQIRFYNKYIISLISNLLMRRILDFIVILSFQNLIDLVEILLNSNIMIIHIIKLTINIGNHVALYSYIMLISNLGLENRLEFAYQSNMMLFKFKCKFNEGISIRKMKQEENNLCLRGYHQYKGYSWKITQFNNHSNRVQLFLIKIAMKLTSEEIFVCYLMMYVLLELRK
ncbi:hypothetical protein pb186bvf_004527 [Paramecium bursaria]